MFRTNFDITGKHADYLKDLCELRGNVANKEQHANFKIFRAYVDAYVLCPLIGYQYGRRVEMEKPTAGDVGILAEQIIKRGNELKYVYQILMLVDEESEPDIEQRIRRAFSFSEDTDEDKAMIAANMKIFNEYFLGGLEILHENFVDECIDDDQYLEKIYKFTKNFNDEQNGDALREAINRILNQ